MMRSTFAMVVVQSIVLHKTFLSVAIALPLYVMHVLLTMNADALIALVAPKTSLEVQEMK